MVEYCENVILCLVVFSHSNYRYNEILRCAKTPQQIERTCSRRSKLNFMLTYLSKACIIFINIEMETEEKICLLRTVDNAICSGHQI